MRRRDLIFISAVLLFSGSAIAGSKANDDEEMLKDLEFFYYMDVVENEVVLSPENGIEDSFDGGEDGSETDN